MPTTHLPRVAVQAIFILAIAGCGAGAARLPVATVVDKDNAICTRYAAQIERLTPPAFDPGKATRADLPTAARYLDHTLPILEAERRDIIAVGEPATDKSLYTSVRNALAAVVRDEQAADTAAHTRDIRAFRAAFTLDAGDTTHLVAVANQLGLTGCVGT